MKKLQKRHIKRVKMNEQSLNDLKNLVNEHGNKIAFRRKAKIAQSTLFVLLNTGMASQDVLNKVTKAIPKMRKELNKLYEQQ